MLSFLYLCDIFLLTLPTNSEDIFPALLFLMRIICSKLNLSRKRSFVHLVAAGSLIKDNKELCVHTYTTVCTYIKKKKKRRKLTICKNVGTTRSYGNAILSVT